MYLSCENMYFTQKMFDELDVCDLNYAKFIGCNFRGLKIKLGDVYLSAITFENCVMSDCEIQINVANLSFRGCDLSGSKFEDSGVIVMYFEGANCEGVDFRGIDYDLEEALGECLNGYNHDPRVLFNGANLRRAKFDGLALNHAQFDEANLEGASFRGCDLSSVEPLDYEQENTYFDYSAATSFLFANLKDVDFEGANLEGVKGLEDL